MEVSTNNETKNYHFSPFQLIENFLCNQFRVNFDRFSSKEMRQKITENWNQKYLFLSFLFVCSGQIQKNNSHVQTQIPEDYFQIIVLWFLFFLNLQATHVSAKSDMANLRSCGPGSFLMWTFNNHY
jgi:hypothetical protein